MYFLIIRSYEDTGDGVDHHELTPHEMAIFTIERLDCVQSGAAN